MLNCRFCSNNFFFILIDLFVKKHKRTYRIWKENRESFGSRSSSRRYYYQKYSICRSNRQKKKIMNRSKERTFLFKKHHEFQSKPLEALKHFKCFACRVRKYSIFSLLSLTNEYLLLSFNNGVNTYLCQKS